MIGRVKFLILHFHQKPIRHIVALIFFIFNRSTLIFEFLLGESLKEKAHSVCFHPQGRLGEITWEGLHIYRSVTGSVSVNLTTVFFDYLEMFLIRYVFGSLKQHMLKKMSKSRFSWRFAS